jgi:hypothetical protein
VFAKLQSEVRRPAVAGAFYPSGARELKHTVEALLSQATKRDLSDLCGVVAPHAGYVYSGLIAGEAFSLLARSSDGPNRILLIGPPHYVPVRGIVAPSCATGARSVAFTYLQDVLRLQSGFAQKQMQSYTRQAQELGQLMAEATRSSKPKG